MSGTTHDGTPSAGQISTIWNAARVFSAENVGRSAIRCGAIVTPDSLSQVCWGLRATTAGKGAEGQDADKIPHPIAFALSTYCETTTRYAWIPGSLETKRMPVTTPARRRASIGSAATSALYALTPPRPPPVTPTSWSIRTSFMKPALTSSCITEGSSRPKNTAPDPQNLPSLARSGCVNNTPDESIRKQRVSPDVEVSPHPNEDAIPE
mmetsp:Transcript_4226/g.10488  ORF Transcript_4226/g.10488 Transcript_4226/m.10488 type:complete len:209 (-) Transcript_4226:398-1024(-)